MQGISLAKTSLTFIYLLLLLDLKPSFGQVQRTINICPTGNIKAASHETLRISLPFGSRQSCTVRIIIPERSWIKFVTNAHSITQSQPGRPCAPGEQAFYIEVTYPGAQTKYYCGSRNSAELVFSRYSRTASQATVTFVIKVPPYVHHAGISSYYQLLYTVARVVYHEGNENVVERVKMKDQIVSHSEYEYTSGHMYPKNINSTLTLTGFKLGSTVRLHFIDFQVGCECDCNDYLEVKGLHYEMSSEIKICLKDSEHYDTTAIATNVSFNFVTDDSDQGRGFRIEYEITSVGCDPNAIEFADIEYNSTFNQFTALCKYGYWFDDTESGGKNISCNLSDSTWSDTTPCSDINECLISNGGCSDVCNNTEGSYLCTCSDSSVSLLSDGLTCSSPDASGFGVGGKGERTNGYDIDVRAKGANTTMYIAVGVAGPVVLIVLIIVLIVVVKRKRRNTESSKPGVTHSISMKEVNVSDKEAITPQDTAEVSKPHNATRTKGCDVVVDEYEPHPSNENSLYQNNQQLSEHHQPTQHRESLDLVDNDLYGT